MTFHLHTRKDELAMFWIPADTDIPMQMKMIGNAYQNVKRMIGGWVERISTEFMPDLYCGCSMIMLVDEDARAKQLEHNVRASIYYPPGILGDVLLVGEGPERATDPEEDWVMGWFSLPQTLNEWDGPGNPLPSQPQGVSGMSVVWD